MRRKGARHCPERIRLVVSHALRLPAVGESPRCDRIFELRPLFTSYKADLPRQFPRIKRSLADRAVH
jgi:hypothetical protein